MTDSSKGNAAIDCVEFQVRSMIERGAIGEALDVIRRFVETVIFDYQSGGWVFADTRIDALCRDIGKSVAANSANAGATKLHGQAGTTILVTELVRAGGHVELLKDIIRLQLFAGPIHIVVTDLFERVDEAFLADFAESHGVTVERARGESSSRRMESVLQSLRIRSAHTLVLMVHNQDSIGIAAAHADAADRVVFMHHGDHHWSLGVTCGEFEHIDPSPAGYFHCRHELSVPNNHYWPLTVNCSTVTSRGKPLLASGYLVSCTSGRPEKFDATNYLFDYLEIIPKMLAATGGRHIHIGELTKSMRVRLQATLLANGVDSARFVHIPWAPSVASALVESNVDVYISSFPLGGGKACIEAMAAGIPLLMHQNYRSRFHGGVDLAYPEAWIWSDETSLMKAIAQMSAVELTRHSSLSRAHYLRCHTDQALIAAADMSSQQDESQVPSLRKYHPDALQVYLDEKTAFENVRDAGLDEIKRIGKEWSAAMGEIDRLDNNCNALTGELERVTGELKRVNAEWSTTIIQRDVLSGENAALMSSLDSPRFLLKALVGATFRRVRHWFL
jgi:hypothetical protein